MKRLLFGTAIVGLAITSVAIQKGTALDVFATTLHGADSVEIKYTLTEVGGGTANYHVILAKPNKAKIVSPNGFVVADGTNITTYWKDRNAYMTKAQTPAELRSLFNDNGLLTWLPFFDVKALDGLASVEDAGTRKRGKDTFKVVEAQADPKGDTKMTYYIDTDDMMVKQGTITVNTAGRETTSVLNASLFKVAAPGEGAFAANIPSGAKEMKPGDFISGVWIHDFDEALSKAKASDKLMLVDFYAVWCGPCKMMAAEAFTSAEFKEATKDMVLAKIDAEKDVAHAKQYGVKAYPTVKFIDGDGNLIHEFVGYGGVAQVLSEVEKAKAKFGSR